MQAVILVGHGSLRAGSGAAMIRLAARAQEAGVAPMVKAGFLNYSRPTFAETLARCVDAGAREVVVLPYFLIPGKFVNEDLPHLLQVGRQTYPDVRFVLGQPFGDHPALARLVLKRAEAGLNLADGEKTGLLIMAHGSPDPQANTPIYAIAERIRSVQPGLAVVVCFMGLNQPDIDAAIDDLAARGVRRMMAVPFFLQSGGHVVDDLPGVIAAARLRYPSATIELTEHLAYDRLLTPVIADRAAEAAAGESPSDALAR